MRKLLLIIIYLFLFAVSYSQEHINFNGATFGHELSVFEKSLNGSNYHVGNNVVEHSYKDLYDRYYVTGGVLNSYSCQYYIHCSRQSKIVFETIVWFQVSNLKEELKLFVAVLEKKYGAHIQQDDKSLGYIWRYGSHTKSNDNYFRKEMLALLYTIYGENDNNPIGEIRISAAPNHMPSNENDSGLIEITYRDYEAANDAIEEYNSIMNLIL